MNVYDAKNIITPEGRVKRILDSSNNVLWEETIDNTVPFFVENITNSNETLSIVKSNSDAPDITIEKSSDSVNWSTFGTTSTTALTQTLQPGERLYLRAAANAWGVLLNSTNYFHRIKGVSKVGGNIMSLLYGSSFGAQDTFPTGSTRTFYYLFSTNINLQDASKLLLPATTLANYCYLYMFEGCTSLTTAPALPATTLAQSCYNGMFYGCSSLTAAPALPATTLANYCYQYMFQNCTSLTTAPALPATALTISCYNNMFNGCTSLTTTTELPATTLKNYCYGGMFNGCSNLTYIKCLATSISATGCTRNWVTGVAAYGIFEKAPNMSSWTTGNDGIPDGWYTSGDEKVPFYVENITDSNETLSIVKGGFNAASAPDVTVEMSVDGETWSTLGTTSTTALTQTIEPGKRLYLRSNTSRWGRYDIMSYNHITGVSKVGGNIMSLLYGGNFTGQETTFPSNVDSEFYQLFRANNNLVSAGNLILPVTTLKSDCYHAMFIACDKLTKGPALPATTLATSCYANMFSGCNALTTAPELKATTLVSYCYASMFNQCNNLTRIKCLATNIGASGCTSNWVTGIAASGTFIKDANMSSWTTGASGIPSGWTVQDL